MHCKFYCLLILIVMLFGLPVLNGSVVYAQKKVVGYYPYWYKSVYPPDKIDHKNLTHINHAFASPQKDGSILTPGGLVDSQLISNAHRAGVKVLICLGGADTTATSNFAVMSADSLTRAKFIDNLIAFIRQNDYDGVDFDWEFPANATEKNQFTSLLKELRVAFSRVDSSLLVTMAASPGGWYGQYFDYEHIAQYLDWVNMMGYDFHGSWSSDAGHNAPLYRNPKDPDNPGSDDEGVYYLLVNRKIPKDKLVLGVPFYGKEFNATGLFATRNGDVKDQIYNADIIPKLNNANWKYFWDNGSEVPYLQDTMHTKLITFDDTVSIGYKCDYVKSKNLAGIMIWALGYDYFNGKSQLLQTIGKSLGLTTEVELANNDKEIPSNYKLDDNYPNPFNPSTVIRFTLPGSGHVKLVVFDVLGREVKVLYDEYLNQGVYEATFDASRLSSGVYFYTMIAPNFIQSKKMILMK